MQTVWNHIRNTVGKKIQDLKKTTEDIIDTQKRKENAINELDYFYKLCKLFPRAAKDHLRGHFGEKHDDWHKANEQANTSFELLNDLGKKEVDFKSRFIAERVL